DYQDKVRAVVEALVGRGSVYSYPSGKDGLDRYWGQDEKQILGCKAIELAATPQIESKFGTALAKVVKGVSKPFIARVIRELIGACRLFKSPPAPKAGGPRFGPSPAPPPVPVLEQATHKKSLDKLVVAAEKLLTSTHASLDDLVARLRDRLARFEQTPS